MQIDFGDGQGLRNVSFGQDLMPAYGEYTADYGGMRATFTLRQKKNGTWKSVRFQVQVVDTAGKEWKITEGRFGFPQPIYKTMKYLPLLFILLIHASCEKDPDDQYPKRDYFSCKVNGVPLDLNGDLGCPSKTVYYYSRGTQQLPGGYFAMKRGVRTL